LEALMFVERWFRSLRFPFRLARVRFGVFGAKAGNSDLRALLKLSSQRCQNYVPVPKQGNRNQTDGRL
jgi:hypothetical protein